MPDPVPLSGANARIKRLRRLAGRRGSRSDEGAFVVEGAVLVREAFASGAGVDEIYVDERRPDLLAEFAAARAQSLAELAALQLQPLDLNALIADVLHLYGEENASVPVKVELDPRCPRIAGDAQQLRQVVHNLLQNAQDATEQAARQSGEPIEPVRLGTHWSASSQRVRLTVADRGTGFAPHILQRAFEPYVTTKSGGTGLGLAVVKKIADEHGARVDLVNRMENGKVQGAQVSLSFAPERKVAS